MSKGSPQRILIAIPVFDDWESIELLLARLDAVLAAAATRADVLVIDDASVAPLGAAGLRGPYRAIGGVETLRLARNLGHQRAIAIGLAFVRQERPCAAVVVMDGDGEDRPQDVPRLLAELHATGGSKVVFAERARRSEGFVFRAFYQVFRALHLLLTGVAVRVGNFSAMPASSLASFVVVSEAWNHYAAAVFKARIPYTMVPLARGTRLAGRSKMRFVSLVMHGLSAISVFGDVAAVRLLIAASIGLLVAAAAFGVSLAGPALGLFDGRTSLVTWSAILAALSAQLVVVAFVIAFSILSARNNPGFLPLRDWRFFVAGVARRFPAEPS